MAIRQNGNFPNMGLDQMGNGMRQCGYLADIMGLAV